MGVVSYREVVGRSITHKFGESPTAQRKFVVTLDSPATNAQDIQNAVGITFKAAHPEFSFLKMVNVALAEGSPSAFHAELTYSYEVDGNDPNPLSRPDVWSFSTSGAAVPCFWYYDGSGNANMKALVNTAYDFFEGATTDEAECRATISGNRSAFPLAQAVAVTNAVNNASYLGAAAHHWKCGGISAQQATEIVNNAEVNYWQITVELVYRQTGWKLMLPNVGYNYLESGVKKRAYVIDPDDNTTKIACASPVGLTNSGAIAAANTAPTILERRVHREVDFGSYFGTPPF